MSLEFPLVSFLVMTEQKIKNGGLKQQGTNAKLTYEYTKDTLKDVEASYNVVTTKLTTLLGFSGLLLKFASELAEFDWLKNVKMVTCFSLVVAVIFCGIGLFPLSSKSKSKEKDSKKRGESVDPDIYINGNEEYFMQPEDSMYMQLANGLNETLKQTRKNRRFRVNCLIVSTYSVGFSILCFAISIMGKAWVYPPEIK